MKNIMQKIVVFVGVVGFLAVFVQARPQDGADGGTEEKSEPMPVSHQKRHIFPRF